MEDVDAQASSLEDSCDDTDVPSIAIIQDTLGITVTAGNFSEQMCIWEVGKDGEHGELIAEGENKKNLGME